MEMMIHWAKTNGVTKERQKLIQSERFDPYELIKLKAMDRKDLLAAMVFCDIRELNGIPVSAMTDDELRMAYILWRAEGQNERKERKRKLKKGIQKVTKFAKERFEEASWK